MFDILVNLLLTWLLIITLLLIMIIITIYLNLFHIFQLEHRIFFNFCIYNVLYCKNSSISIYWLIERACPLHKFRFNRISIYEYLYFYSLNFTAMPFFSSTSTCPSFFSVSLALFLFSAFPLFMNFLLSSSFSSVFLSILCAHAHMQCM